MARFDAARRVIQTFHRRRITARRTNIALAGTKNEPAAVTIDTLTVAENKIHIKGRAQAMRFSFATELGYQSVTLDKAGGLFDVTVNGSVQLTVRVEGFPTPFAINPQTRVVWMRNTLATAWALAGILGHIRDIWAYFARGDSDAGDRLERLVVPPQASEKLPLAHPGLFVRTDIPKFCRAPVNIVVPVFNAFDDVKRCLDHLAKHTSDQHRILIVDDKSTDERMRPFLEEWCDARSNSELIFQNKNSGFVEAVNTGLNRADGHVVLLNTDAFVPENWLDRLMRPILMDSDVASATPMSSNGEIMTAPVDSTRFACETGQAEGLDRVANTFNADAATADLPTGVGFCMALSSHWLERVQDFDTVFGRGYGEEVDWCRKVAALGGRHVGVGNLFVEHLGGTSFGDEKPARLHHNARIINARYPGYDQLVADFRRLDPLIGPRLALALASMQGETPVPVYVAQRLGGGSEAWLDAEIEEFSRHSLGAVILRSGPDQDTLIIEAHTRSGLTCGAIPRDELGDYLSHLGQFELRYSGLVASHAPLDLLAVLLKTLRKTDRLTVYFHDFFPLCPSYNLISAGGAFCNVPPLDTCQRCYEVLGQTSGNRPPTISQWRAAWERFLERADCLIVFSENSARILRQVWPDFSDNILVEPHTIIDRPRSVNTSPAAPPVVGVLGSIGYNKGAGVLKALAEQSNGGFRIVVIGELDPSYRHRRIEVHGAYDRRAIADLAEFYGVTNWFVPSIWPETFCFAAHECLSTGLPVLAFDIGAHGAEIADHPNGTVLPASLPLSTLWAEVSEWVTASRTLH